MSRQAAPVEIALTHEHADFDAVASMVGLARLRPGLVPVMPIVVNQNVRDFLALYGSELPLVERSAAPTARVSRVWLVDTTAAQLVRGIRRETPRSIIDHHVDEALPDVPNVEAQVEAVGATSTLMVERLAAGGVESPRAEATLLLLGIYEDTGRLSFGGTTPRDLRAAAWLLDRGADLELTHRFLSEALSPTERALMNVLIEAAESHRIHGHEIAIAAADAPGFEGELAHLATRMLERTQVDGLFTVVGLGTHVQVVARSRTDAVDVGGVAEGLGGGGHRRASAAVVDDLPPERVAEQILESLPDHVRPAHRVAEIMSRGGVRTLDAEASVRDARRSAELHGHEGYPVMDGDAVVGVVTREDIDRGIRHGLADEPIRRLLGPPPPLVTPGTSIEALQDIMLDTQLGQIPVVEDGRIAGIVTRTDLLNLWVERDRGATAPRIDLAEAFPAAVWTAIQTVADEARRQHVGAYLVGGVPRDLLLGIPAGVDIDIVVEGDAIALAQSLATRHGGRVRAHRRFGTAKWLRGAGDGGTAIDLVSARTEFYEAPTALPGVERGSLKSDLRRRDFTINTLAIDLRLEDGRHAPIIDLFGGLRDLNAGMIRALHSLSFVEDPTRILRAERFAARLGFHMEERTAQRMREAVPLIRRVSGARIRNELTQLFAEPDPDRVLANLEAVGVLSALDPPLARGERTGRTLEALPATWSRWATTRPDLPLPAPTPRDGFVLWVAAQTRPGQAANRLALTRRDATAAADIATLWAGTGAVSAAGPAADVLFDALAQWPASTLVLAWTGAVDPRVRRNLGLYLSRLAGMETDITGADVLEMGVPAGPRVGRILEAVLRARLAGDVSSRSEELALARRLTDADDPTGVEALDGG